MLINASDFIGMPVLSLRTGDQIAQVDGLVVDPYELKIQAFRLSGRQLDKPNDSYLMPSDIREISRLGLIINDSEEVVNSTDIIKLKQILQLDFELLNLPVIDNQHRKIGKVVDYVIIDEFFFIYQIIAKRSFWQGFLDPELTIHRSQIAKLSKKQLVINSSLTELKELERQQAINSFVNPFRQTPDTKKSTKTT